MGDGQQAKLTAPDELRSAGEQDLAFLSYVIQGFVSTLALEEAFTIVLEELRHLLKVTASSIWLIDPDTRELVCLQATGPHHNAVCGWRMPRGIERYGGRLTIASDMGRGASFTMWLRPRASDDL